VSDDDVQPEPTAAGEEAAPRPRQRPRNYLAPGDRRWLFWRFMPAALGLFLVLGWVERTWFAKRDRGRAQIDTRLDAVAGRPPVGDEVVIEREPEPFEPDNVAALGASVRSLSAVRDATFFREGDYDAWFQIWKSLGEGSIAAFQKAGPQDVGFSELFGQPRSFRGRLVRMRGVFHRLEKLAAPANDYGIEHYWQGWLEPANGPSSPVVVQCLRLPAGMPEGMEIHEPVEVIGYFFKNYAYNASDTIRVAPLIMISEPIRLPEVSPARKPLVGEGLVSGIVFGSMAALIGASWLAMSRTGSLAGRAPKAAGLDAALADVEPFSVAESLRQVAAAEAARERKQPTEERGT
jgi:hypothetical protein